jgi:predicted PurR-regulated permease PerM
MEKAMREEDGDGRTLADWPAVDEPRRRGLLTPLLIAAIVVAGLYFASPILEPFALAVLLSLMLAPAVRWLRRFGFGKVTAVSTVVALACILILGFAAAVGDEAISLMKDLPKYEQNIAGKIRSLNGSVPGAGIVGRATRVFDELSSEFGGHRAAPAPLAASGGGAARWPVPVEVVGHDAEPLQILRDVAGPLLLPVAAAGLVLLFVVMILLKREDLRDRMLRIVGVRDLHRTTAAMNEAAERVSRYLLSQLAVGICYGVPVGIGLAVIGIPSALLWGMLGVAMRFLPYIGGPLTAVLPCALAIAVAPGWGLFLWTVLLFAGMEVVIANVVEPWIYARTTGLSAVAVVAAAVFWAWLWGIVGLLLATPLTVCIVVLGRYVPHLQFLDILLGNEPVLSPEESLYQRLLARDPEEATEQAEEFARGKSLVAFCDEVAIAALAMAQADSDRGALSDHRRAVVAEGFAAILDNLAEEIPEEPEEGDAAAPWIACLAGRNELDLAAAWLLQHLLRRRGHRVRVFSPEALSAFNLDRLPLQGAAVVCLSLVSSTSAAGARYLVRRIRRRARRAIVMLGFWGRRSQDFAVDEALAVTAADRVVITLAGAMAAIEEALGGGPRPNNPPLLEKLTRQSA